MTSLTFLLNTLGINSSSLTPFIPYDTGMSFLLITDGENALPTWYALRQVAVSSGVWPVLLGDLGTYSEQEHFLQQLLVDVEHISVTDTITASLATDPLTWFRSQAQRLDNLYHSSHAPQEPSSALRPTQSIPASSPPSWRLQSDPYIPERNTFRIPTELIYPQAEDSEPTLCIQPLSTVYLALFPTQTAWHIPAYLPTMGGNALLSVIDHLLVWRWWNSNYHAEIVGVAGSSIEAWVEAPPIDLQQSKRLAWEQQVYCPDIVTLVNDLPVDLNGAFVWNFWWD